MKNYKIQQFKDDGLAHFSYAILVNEEIVLVDPARDPQPYFEFADANNAKIIGVIETHPHADFVSSHLEIHHAIGSILYSSAKVGADYPHHTFDEGEVIRLGEKIELRSLFTPGHSPDSISVVLSEEGKDRSVFTGDTLFIGDVGRPDLREDSGKMHAKREELARMMYNSTRKKLMVLDDNVVVFPAHGSGTLCGKSLSDASSSTIGAEKTGNYALREMSEDDFVKLLLEDQPFIPKYFPYDVELNKQGAPDFEASVQKVLFLEKNFHPETAAIIVDGRNSDLFKASHLQGAYNIMEGEKFETWLGSIVGPGESYYLVGKDKGELDVLIRKAAKIGYELNIKAAFVFDAPDGGKFPSFEKQHFQKNKEEYTILDVRNSSEVKDNPIFHSSINIPLPELRERAREIETDKPIAVHCSGGYRSAAASSIVKAELPGNKVLDMGETIQEFIK